MLCYAMLCYAMLCYAMLCYAMLCYAMLCYAMLCYAMLCYAMLCYAMLCYADLSNVNSRVQTAATVKVQVALQNGLLSSQQINLDFRACSAKGRVLEWFRALSTCSNFVLALSNPQHTLLEQTDQQSDLSHLICCSMKSERRQS